MPRRRRDFAKEFYMHTVNNRPALFDAKLGKIRQADRQDAEAGIPVRATSDEIAVDQRTHRRNYPQGAGTGWASVVYDWVRIRIP